MEYICNDCPRSCNVIRNEQNISGYCSCYSLPTVSRAAPHYGEEPCISGVNGSGAVFFSGCNLRCIFCQNAEISRRAAGKELSPSELSDTFLRLQDSGVHNINLVTPTHFLRTVVNALEIAKLTIPVVWNSSGYEKPESLRLLDGLVQIYMPDYKYSSQELAAKYSAAPDYPEVAAEAIKEMYRQRGKYVVDNDGIMQSGLLIRHLVLPDNLENTMNVIDFVADEFEPGSVIFSLMSQYTPMFSENKYSELTRRLTKEESESMIIYMQHRHIEDGYYQSIDSANSEMIPSFDLTGL